MDLQKGMLDKTKRKADASKLTNIKFLHAAAGDGKLEHNKFDRITLVTVLGEIPNQQAATPPFFKGGEGLGFDYLLIFCNKLIISNNPIAASEPLLPTVLPARARACSIFSVVKTPNVIGIPVCI